MKRWRISDSREEPAEECIHTYPEAFLSARDGMARTGDDSGPANAKSPYIYVHTYIYTYIHTYILSRCRGQNIILKPM